MIPLHARCHHTPLSLIMGSLRLQSVSNWALKFYVQGSHLFSTISVWTSQTAKPEAIPRSWRGFFLGGGGRRGRESETGKGGEPLRGYSASWPSLNVHGPVGPSVSQDGLSRRGERGRIWSTGSLVHCQSLAPGFAPRGPVISATSAPAGSPLGMGEESQHGTKGRCCRGMCDGGQSPWKDASSSNS